MPGTAGGPPPRAQRCAQQSVCPYPHFSHEVVMGELVCVLRHTDHRPSPRVCTLLAWGNYCAERRENCVCPDTLKHILYGRALVHRITASEHKWDLLALRPGPPLSRVSCV